MNNMTLSNKQKNIMYFLAVFLLCVVCYFSVISFSRIGTYQLTVATIPTSELIMINGVVVSKNTYLKPGIYDIEVKNGGFFTYKQTITISEVDKVISNLLVPESETAKKWVSNNTNLYAEGYDNTNANNPILNSLPYKNLIFSIDTEEPVVPNKPLTLNIVTMSGYKNAPIEKIRNFGYDPTNYSYTFNSTNPFENE